MREITLNEFKRQYIGKEIGYFYLSNEKKLEYKLFSDEIVKETKLIYLLHDKQDLYLGTIASLTLKQTLDMIKKGYFKHLTFKKIHNLLKERLKYEKTIIIKVFIVDDVFTINLDLIGNSHTKVNINFKTKEEDEIMNIEPNDILFYNDLPYNRIIYGAPGTGKSYKLKNESSLFKRRIVKEKSDENSENQIKNNYWLVTCGYGNYAWEIFKKQNIFSVGWREIKNVLNKPYEQLKEEARVLYGKDYFLSYFFYLAKEIKIGDIIIVREGRKKIAAYGVVNKTYFEEQVFENGKEVGDFFHNIGVEWKKEEIKTLNTYKNMFSMNTISTVNSELKKAFEEEYMGENTKEKYEEKEISTVERVTFYDGYTYGQFVGTYKPVPCLVNGVDSISYKYVPGIFMKQLIKAYKNPDDNFCLIIEEINRAKADRVFGNIFQLLDRNSDGRSQYRIAVSEEQENYLEEELNEFDFEILDDIKENGLYIPKNLYIWATMNSADQGVYPLDSAFKRRWHFEHIGLDDNSECMDSRNGKVLVVEYNSLFIKWNDFRQIINDKLLNNGILEDRLIAPFFVEDSSFKENIDFMLLDKKVFVEKILMYLFDDILKHNRKDILFKSNVNSFSKLKQIIKNENIFTDDILEKLKEKALDINSSEIV